MRLPPLRMPSLRRPKKQLGPDVIVPPRRRAIVVVQSCLLILLLVVVIGAWRSGRDDAPEEVASLAPTVPPVATAPPTVASTVPPTAEPVASTAPATVPASTDASPPSTIGPTDVEPGTYDFLAAAGAPVEPGEAMRLSLGDDTFEFVWNETGALQVTTALEGLDEVTIIADQASDQAYVRMASDAPGAWGSLSLDEATRSFGIEFEGLDMFRGQKIPVEELPAPIPLGITSSDQGDVMVYVLDIEGEAIGAIDWDALLRTPTNEAEIASVDRLEYRWSVTEDNRLVKAEGVVTIGPLTLSSTIEFEPGVPFTLPDPALVEPFDLSQLDGDAGTLTA